MAKSWSTKQKESWREGEETEDMHQSDDSVGNDDEEEMEEDEEGTEKENESSINDCDLAVVADRRMMRNSYGAGEVFSMDQAYEMNFYARRTLYVKNKIVTKDCWEDSMLYKVIFENALGWPAEEVNKGMNNKGMKREIKKIINKRFTECRNAGKKMILRAMSKCGSSIRSG